MTVVDRNAWLMAAQGQPSAAAIAVDWWYLIETRVAKGCTVEEAAEATYRDILACYNLKGIGDLRYQGAIRLIEVHMPEGAALRRWHAQEFGV